MQVNPAHPKQIGSIDPYCRVRDVIKGKQTRTRVPSQLYFILISFMSCLAALFLK